MFVLFGLRSKDHVVSRDLGVCEVCGNQAAQTRIRRTTKFTLFFVPLFPVKPAGHYVLCAFCGAARKA